jgi:hypothetical protein
MAPVEVVFVAKTFAVEGSTKRNSLELASVSTAWKSFATSVQIAARSTPELAIGVRALVISWINF